MYPLQVKVILMEMIGPIYELFKLMRSPIGKLFTYHRSLNKNTVVLHRELQALYSRKEDIESMIQTQLHTGKEMKKEVMLWLQNVQSIRDEVEVINQEVGEGRFFSRARLGKLVSKKIQIVEELYQKGSFADSVVVDAPLSIDLLPTTAIIGETTAKRCMEEVWTFLMDENINKVGVYGMGGVGKTTILKHIYNRLLTEVTLFDQVVWVTVSKTANVFQLQNDIAQAFELIIPENQNETIRAAKLYSMLKMRQSYVLILDDLWEDFNLEDVGIPEPVKDNKCKLLLTTRSSDICSKMECKQIKVPLLSHEEAWELFLEKVGKETITSGIIEKIAKDIATECDRLPLAIVTVARSMKGVSDISGWRNALEELRDSTKGLNDMRRVYEHLKFSYLHLQDEGLKQCLLYCTLYPEDQNIGRKELIELLIAEGVIEGRTRQAELDKGHAMLNRLENACLLESVMDNQNNRWVKMHDLIRDIALQITSMRFLVKAGLCLREFPCMEEWTENLIKVSLMQNFISEIPSTISPKCPRLSTLLLSSTYLTQIPHSFFLHLSALQILDLSDTSIEHLPNSISDLETLTTLLLRGCTRLVYVPPVNKLVELRKLDLNHTKIKEVPKGMEMLKKLKYLNLYAEYLEILPHTILPKLPCLQFLVVYGASKTLKLKGEEIACLRNLEAFAGQFYGPDDLNAYVRSVKEMPNNYIIRVGAGNRVTIQEEKESFEKDVKLTNCIINGDKQSPLLLPEDMQTLSVEQCHDISSLIDVLSLNTATKLRSCAVGGCNGIKYLVGPASIIALETLESLQLFSLNNLHALLKDGATSLAPGTFSSLKKFEIIGCDNISNLFTKSMLFHLQNLEDLKVKYCRKIEEIISTEMEERSGEKENQTVTTLPVLKKLHFYSLPKLKSIYTGTLECSSLEVFEAYQCPNLKRIPLFEQQPLPALQRISAYKEWWETLEWDQPRAKDALQPFLQFDIISILLASPCTPKNISIQRMVGNLGMGPTKSQGCSSAFSSI
ncbi:hypothetical protein RIF29_30849 [Crotalaria pallida]|uniref:Uncharacterized protein n=1 Tax=Crotalaria pallida TaxID=3830 RepID=A0AAN9EGL8_CROPI